MPYPNQHSARIEDPDNFDSKSFRTKQIASGVSIIMGKYKTANKETDSTHDQAYRFDKDKFTAEEAKDWLKKNKVKYISFEPATGKEASERVVKEFCFVDFLDKIVWLTEDTKNGGRAQQQIMKCGKFRHPFYGLFEITPEDIKLFKENFDNNVRKVELAVDKEHNPEDGAVGWFKELIDAGKKGLWAIIDWTKEGAELIKSKKFKYFSPNYLSSWEDEETGDVYKDVLLGGALTNRPFLKGMQAMVLSESVEETERQPSPVLQTIHDKDEKGEEASKIQNGGEIKMAEIGEKELAELREKADQADKLQTENTELKGKVASGETAEKQLKDQAADAIVGQAIADKKITPAQKEWAKEYALKDPEGFKNFVANAHAVVDTTEIGKDGQPTEEVKKKINEKRMSELRPDDDPSMEVTNFELSERAKVIMSEKKLSYREALKIAQEEAEAAAIAKKED